MMENEILCADILTPDSLESNIPAEIPPKREWKTMEITRMRLYAFRRHLTYFPTAFMLSKNRQCNKPLLVYCSTSDSLFS